MVFVVVSVVKGEISRSCPTLEEFKYWLKYLVFFSAFHCRASCFAFASPTSFQNCTSSLQACSAFQRGNMIPRSEWCQHETVCLVLFFCKLFLCLHCEMKSGGWGGSNCAQLAPSDSKCLVYCLEKAGNLLNFHRGSFLKEQGSDLPWSWLCN